MTFKTYLVGGAVRDALMGVTEVSDMDYVVVGATNADMLARGYTNVGQSFPVYMDENGDQWALARRERKTGNGYQGFDVEVGSDVTLEDDLMRRDLTINAIARDVETGEIIDPFGGREDLKDKVLRHVSPAFAEDPLRVIRLARFAARWPEFTIAQETWNLCSQLVRSGELNHLSNERFYAEMAKMFKQSDSPSVFFSFLHAIDAFERVDFFRELFGAHPDIDFMVRVAKDAKGFAAESNGSCDPLDLLLGICSRADEFDSPVIPTEVRTLARNMRMVCKMNDVTADNLHELISRNRGFSNHENGSSIRTLMWALRLARWSGAEIRLHPVVLNVACQDGAGVTAAMFPNLSGKELGEAITAERKRRIARTLEV